MDSYGTFPLPHSQLDRFTASLSIGDLSTEDQVAILERNQLGDPEVDAVLDSQSVQEMQRQVRDVAVARPIREYVANILASIQSHADVLLGASPRAGVHLQRAAQALAAMDGSGFVAPEHVKAVAARVLTHRMILASNVDGFSDDLIDQLVHGVPVPL